jgi:hypothetical protein
MLLVLVTAAQANLLAMDDVVDLLAQLHAQAGGLALQLTGAAKGELGLRQRVGQQLADLDLGGLVLVPPLVDEEAPGLRLAILGRAAPR